jgi:hypothetical protein
VLASVLLEDTGMKLSGFYRKRTRIGAMHLREAKRPPLPAQREGGSAFSGPSVDSACSSAS